MPKPIITFVADPREPEVYNDVTDLASNFSMNIPIGIANTSAIELWYKISVVSAPADYTVSSQELGSISASASNIFAFTLNRDMPTLTNGEFDETLDFKIEAFTDSGYSVPYGDIILSVPIHHFNHVDPSWSVIDHSDFDDGTKQGWEITNGVVDGSLPHSGFSSTQYTGWFLSAPYSLSYASPFNQQHNLKTFNTSAFSKARFVLHVRRATPYDPIFPNELMISINNVLVKPAGVPTPAEVWVRVAFNMPIGASIPVKFAAYQGNPVYIDEIWVIAK